MDDILDKFSGHLFKKLVKIQIKNEYINSCKVENFIKKFNKYSKNLTLNPNISIKFLEDNDLIDWDNIEKCPTISKEFIVKHRSKLKINLLKFNPEIDHDLAKYLYCDLEDLLECRHIFERDILEFNEKYDSHYFEKKLQENKNIWKNPNISESFLIKYKHLAHDSCFENPNITEKFIEEIKNVNYTILASNKFIAESFFELYLANFNDDAWFEFCKNPNISFEFLLTNFPKKYGIKPLLSSPNITRKFILDNEDEIFNNHVVQILDKDIGEELVNKYEYLISWTILSSNTHFSEDFWKRNINRCNINKLVANSSLSEEFISNIFCLWIDHDIFESLCTNTFRYYHKINYNNHKLSSYL